MSEPTQFSKEQQVPFDEWAAAWRLFHVACKKLHELSTREGGPPNIHIKVTMKARSKKEPST
jgi:hypothetical protein